MSTSKSLAKLARLDSDIESLRARLEVKLGEREDILAELIAEGEAIRAAVLPQAIAGLKVATGQTLGQRKVVNLFTDEQVREIRALHAAGHSQAALGRRFSVSQPAINHIVNRRTYKDVA